MKAEILSVGTELLMGEITDTNSPFLAGQLLRLGIELQYVSQLGDKLPMLVDALQRAWNRSQVILITGGLGPTADDLTREAVAEFLKETPAVQPELEQNLRQFFSLRNLKMSPSNLKQAWLIPSAVALPNPRGTAPGWWIDKDGHLIALMPGPPGEMQRMWQNEVMPRLRQKAATAIIVTRTFKTFGLAESKVGELVAPLFSLENPLLGIYAKPDGIHLRLSALARDEQAAIEILSRYQDTIFSSLGDYIWGRDDETLEAVTGRILVARNLSLAVMECGTGGQLSAMISTAPAAPAYFKGALIANSPQAQTTCGLDPDLFHPRQENEAARAMAEQARNSLKADVGIGIYGDSGDQPPASLFFICVSDGKEYRNTRGSYPGDRGQIRRRAATAALFELRKVLLDIEDRETTPDNK